MEQNNLKNAKKFISENIMWIANHINEQSDKQSKEDAVRSCIFVISRSFKLNEAEFKKLKSYIKTLVKYI